MGASVSGLRHTQLIVKGPGNGGCRRLQALEDVCLYVVAVEGSGCSSGCAWCGVPKCLLRCAHISAVCRQAAGHDSVTACAATHLQCEFLLEHLH